MTDETSDPRVERTVDFDVDVDELWHLISEPDELATWLADEVELDEVREGATGRVVDDGTVRTVRIEEVEVGRRIVWEWWDDEATSSVALEVEPHPGGSRLFITETAITETAATATTTGPTWLRWEVRAAVLCCTVVCRLRV